MFHRLEGGDLSDADPLHFITDVPRVYSIYSLMTFDLAKMNLKSAAATGLGTRMGAAVYHHHAGTDGSSGFGESVTMNDEEVSFFDSVTADRTCCGALWNMDCCCPPIYKITSERYFSSLAFKSYPRQ